MTQNSGKPVLSTPVERVRVDTVPRTLEGMENQREYDQDTVGDYQENSLDEKLAAERADIDSPEPEDEGALEEPHDQIDDLDPEGGTRVLGEA